MVKKKNKRGKTNRPEMNFITNQSRINLKKGSIFLKFEIFFFSLATQRKSMRKISNVIKTKKNSE